MDPLELANRVVIPLATLALTGVGIWFANSYRRKMEVGLAESRREAYAGLWLISGLAAPTRLDAKGIEGHLSSEERCHIWGLMTDWYYRDGNGMLLVEGSKTLYLNAKNNLVSSTEYLKPRGLANAIREELSLANSGEFDDQLRGILSIKQLSLLRTQLKSDLSIYGQTYAETLEPHEVFFLEQSRVDLGSRAWRKAVREARLDDRSQQKSKRWNDPTQTIVLPVKMVIPPSALELLDRKSKPGDS